MMYVGEPQFLLARENNKLYSGYPHPIEMIRMALRSGQYVHVDFTLGVPHDIKYITLIERLSAVARYRNIGNLAQIIASEEYPYAPEPYVRVHRVAGITTLNSFTLYYIW